MMHKFSLKSWLYLPLMALAIGIIPVLMLPPAQNVMFTSTGAENAARTVLVFPMHYGARELMWTQFVLLLPFLMAVWSLVKGKKSYHGLYAVFITLGFLIKSQDLNLTSQCLLAVMCVAAAVNIGAYLHARGETFDDWLKHYFQVEKRTRAYSGLDGFQSNAKQHNYEVYRGGNIHNHARIAKFTFNKLIGMQEFKDRLAKAGKEALEAKVGKSGRNGILLGGEPGNGKTVMAEALAGHLNIPIISVAFGEFASMWVNETTQRVMQVFDDAEAQAPCMLFIDEIDAVLIDRSKVIQAEAETGKTVAAMLRRLETIRDRGVVVVAATNFMERLDPASIREGRFDFKLEVPPPDFDARKFLLADGLKKANVPVDNSGLERAAKRWEGFSVARIRAIATETLDLLNNHQIQQIGFDALALALRRLNASKGTRIPEDALTIEELVLSDEMRDRLQKLANRMTNIERIEEMGGSVPAGVLFYGPPGTGKTIGAMALAKASGWAFIATTGHDLLHQPTKIDDIIKTAHDIRPCIVFIDEADDVLADRRYATISKDVTNKLLTAMDGAGGKRRDVLFIASTNAPDLIDEAMLRGGRFTEKVSFALPNEDALRTYVAQWLANTKAPLADEFTVDAVATLIKGESLANSKEILQTAVNEAISGSDIGEMNVTLNHLIAAIKIVKGA